MAIIDDFVSEYILQIKIYFQIITFSNYSSVVKVNIELNFVYLLNIFLIMSAIKTLKEASIEVLKNLPEAASVDDIMYQINLTAKVMKGLEDEKTENLISSEQLLVQITKWKK